MVSMKKREDTFLIKYHYIQQNYYGKNQDGIVKNKQISRLEYKIKNIFNIHEKLPYDKGDSSIQWEMNDLFNK